MARPKLFDPDVALDAAISVFREHGYASTSAEMLAEAMQIGKQSIYDTFGSKWPLYCAAVERYSASETGAHIANLKGGTTALAGIEQMMKRVVVEARQACLGISSICEFGADKEELNQIRAAAGKLLRNTLTASVRKAQAEGDLSAGLDAREAAAFLLANIAAIRLAARGGADDAQLRSLGRLSLQALR